jgi:DNA-binding response OmpR family regulator
MLKNSTVVVIEDDPIMLEIQAALLTRHGYNVEAAIDAAGARRIFERGHADLYLLDIGLPDDDGLTLLQEIRRKSDVPVIVVSGNAEPVERILGLEFGADDYVVKPFEPRELLARVRAVIKRSQPAGERVMTAIHGPIYHFAGYVMDPLTRKLHHPGADRVIELTSSEFDLLLVLVAAAGRPLSRDQLLDATKARQWEPYDRSIDVMVGRIRKKIESHDTDQQIIKTVTNIGYVLAQPVKMIKTG